MKHEAVSLRRLESDLKVSLRHEARGFVFDSENLGQKFVVELLADGLPIGLYRADAFVEELGAASIGDGCYGFAAILPETIVFGATALEARLANSGEIVGAALKLGSSRTSRAFEARSQVRWSSGLRFEGWLEDLPGQAPRTVRALVDGQQVAEATPSGWVHIERGEGFVVGRSFQLDLPSRYADGKARQVEMLASDGGAILGSPCAFVGFEDGLEAFVDRQAELESEKIRARLTDRLFPQTWPFADFDRWQARFPQPRPAAPDGATVTVVFIGEAGIEASLHSLEAQVLCPWTAACLPDTGVETCFHPDDLLEFLADDAAASDIVVFAAAGTRFTACALGLMRDALAACPPAQSVYCDLVMTGDDGLWPLALPAFDYERCLEQGYCGLVFGMRREAAESAAKAGAGSLVRLFNRQFDAPLASGAEPLHIPLMLATLPAFKAADLKTALAEAAGAHFRTKRLAARIVVADDAELPTVRIVRNQEPGHVSIIIPTRNRADLLETCLSSLEKTLGETECEIIIADNDSSETRALALLQSAARQGAKVVRVPGAFNYSRINNQAAALATGRYLLLLNNDVEALEAGWLEEMLGRIAEPDVGAVGPVLLWPSGVVQHAGVVLGPHFAAAHAFGDRIAGEAGYGGLLHAAHERSAVTGACLLTRRDLYNAHGGLDEIRFAVDYNDVDYCLKLRASGYRVVLTPHARLRHAESSSRGRYERPDQQARRHRELDCLRAKWGDVLAADPYYNPSLTLGGPPYSGLAWPPRSREARQPGGRPPRHVPPGF